MSHQSASSLLQLRRLMRNVTWLRGLMNTRKEEMGASKRYLWWNTTATFSTTNFGDMDNSSSHWKTYFLQQNHIFLSNSSFRQIRFISCSCKSSLLLNSLLVAWYSAYLYYSYSKEELNVSLGQRLPDKKVNQIQGNRFQENRMDSSATHD